MMEFEGAIPAETRQVLDTRNVQEIPFPEDPNERFEAIFAAIGNSEAKCLSLLCLEPYFMTVTDIKNRAEGATNGVWKRKQATYLSHLETTLQDIGLVVEADFIPYGSLKYTTGFRASEAGLKFGQPIAAFLLQKSSDFPHSLGELFSTTAKTGELRPIIRAVKILEYLYGLDGYSTDLEIMSVVGGKDMSGPLNRLGDVGLIEHESVNTEKTRQVQYSLTERANDIPIKTAYRLPTLTNQIAEIMLDLKTADYLTVTKELETRFGKIVKRANVNGVISGLCTQGILSSDYRGARRMSKSRITTEGKRLLEEVIFPIKQALSLDGEELLESWRKIDWRKYAVIGLQRNRETPTNLKRKSIQSWASDVLELVIADPGIRGIEIQRKINRISFDILRVLLDEGRIKKVKKGREARFYPIEWNPTSASSEIQTASA
jgi:hypothetical protein